MEFDHTERVLHTGSVDDRKERETLSLSGVATHAMNGNRTTWEIDATIEATVTMRGIKATDVANSDTEKSLARWGIWVDNSKSTLSEMLLHWMAFVLCIPPSFWRHWTLDAPKKHPTIAGCQYERVRTTNGIYLQQHFSFCLEVHFLSLWGRTFNSCILHCQSN